MTNLSKSILSWMFLTLLGVASAWAQSAPTVQWERTFQRSTIGIRTTVTKCVSTATPDGGVLAGIGIDSLAERNSDQLIKYRSDGSIAWSKPIASVALASPTLIPFGVGNLTSLYITDMATAVGGGYFVFGVSNIGGTNGGHYILKIDEQGSLVWYSQLTPPEAISTSAFFNNDRIIPTRDGGCVAISRYTSFRSTPTTVFKIDANGLKNPVLDFSGSTFAPVTLGSIKEVNDGYVVIGTDNTAQPGVGILRRGLVQKYDANFQLVWSKVVDNEIFSDIIQNPKGPGYLAIQNANSIPVYEINAIGDITRKTAQLTSNSSFSGSDLRLVVSSQGNVFITGSINTEGVRNTSFNSFVMKLVFDPDQIRGSLLYKTQYNGGAAPYPSLSQAPDGSLYVSGLTPESTMPKTGYLVKLVEQATTTPPVGNFALTAPGYDCNTGQLTLNTTGGNGTTIDYRIVGLRDWATSNSFTVPTYQRNGTSFTLEARQSGQVVTLGFTTACGTTTPPSTTTTTPPSTTTTTPPTGSFAVLTPGYDCNTGQLTAQVANAGSASVEYRIIGLRDWGSSPTFSVPTYQRTGTTFKVEARTSSGAYASTDFATACGTTTPTPSPLPSPININPASYTLVANVPYFNAPFELASGVYGAADSRLQNFIITATGLPPGMNLSINRLMGFFSVSITGQPTTVGVYPVTLTATDTSAPGSAPYATRVTITIVNGNTGTLALSLPSYGCQTGAITFYTTGGDGSVITYVAPGVSRSSATSNTGFVEAGLRADPKPLVIQATQSGQTVSYTFDFKAYCGGAGRLANAELGQRWQMELLGNPVEEQVQVRLSGSAGQTIQLRLSDAAGRAVSERTVQLQAEEQTETLRVGGSAGVYVLGAESQGQRQALKVLKK